MEVVKWIVVKWKFAGKVRILKLNNIKVLNILLVEKK